MRTGRTISMSPVRGQGLSALILCSKTSGTRIKPAAVSILIAMRMALPATPIYSAVSPACPFHPSHLDENWRAMSAMRSLSARK